MQDSFPSFSKKFTSTIIFKDTIADFSSFFLFFCKLFQNPRGLPHPSSFKNSRIARTKASALSTVDKWPPEI